MGEVATIVRRPGDFLVDVRGTFFRAIGRDHVGLLLKGSIRAGRYSRADQPTLYLGSSPAAVEAAMIAHRPVTLAADPVFAVRVEGAAIFDLANPAAMAAMRSSVGDPCADWQVAAASEITPPSWRVRERIEADGASGLIDPSRQAPGLWHLVLFRWNQPGAPTVTLLD